MIAWLIVALVVAVAGMTAATAQPHRRLPRYDRSPRR